MIIAEQDVVGRVLGQAAQAVGDAEAARRRCAVPGISCIMPRAPARLTAERSNSFLAHGTVGQGPMAAISRRDHLGESGARKEGGALGARLARRPHAHVEPADLAAEVGGDGALAVGLELLGERADEQGLVGTAADHAEMARRGGERPAGEGRALGRAAGVAGIGMGGVRPSRFERGWP